MAPTRIYESTPSTCWVAKLLPHPASSRRSPIRGTELVHFRMAARGAKRGQRSPSLRLIFSTGIARSRTTRSATCHVCIRTRSPRDCPSPIRSACTATRLCDQSSLAEGAQQSNVEQVTIIQAPYRVGLSPISDLTWKVRSAGTADRPDLDGTLDYPRRVVETARGLVSRFQARQLLGQRLHTHRNVPFRSSLDPHDRHELWHSRADSVRRALLDLRASFRSRMPPSEGVFVPQPVQARLALFSSFGATLRLKGHVVPPQRPRAPVGVH